MRIGSLFAGVGGLELGLERAGVGHVVWQVEIDPFCRLVLAKHWPSVDRSIRDVCVAGASTLAPVDLICGGFPCQDVSSAGRQAGLKEGTRSGLWLEFARVVGELRPRFVVVENVASGKRLWLPQVRGDLHVLGYRTRAIALSAADVGAWHLRKRIFIIANADGFASRGLARSDREISEADASHAERDPVRQQSRRSGGEGGAGTCEPGDAGHARHTPHTHADRESPVPEYAEVAGAPSSVPDDDSAGRQGAGADTYEVRNRSAANPGWPPEPDVGRVVHGLSGGVDGRLRRARIRALGNAVVPACAEVIGKMLIS